MEQNTQHKSAGQTSCVILSIALLPWLCGCVPDASQELILADISASVQRDKLVVEARLSPEFIDQTMALLNSGESILISYQFELLQKRRWLPDKSMTETIIHRRLRRNLILERFEMQDMTNKQTSFTADDGEATRFLGNPRYIALGQSREIQSGKEYRIDARFQLEQEGISRMLRVLHSWIFFWKPNAYYQHITYRPS